MYKIQVLDNYFKITDDNNDVRVHLPMNKIYYKPNDEHIVFYESINDKSLMKGKSFKHSDLMDENNVQFPSYNDLISFVGKNTGNFSPAVGGSTAFFGIADYNDLATQTVGINIPSNGNYVDIPNDGQGVFTNLIQYPDNVSDVWNVGLQMFDLSTLPLGSKMDYRLDISVTTTSPNQDIVIVMELGIGGFPYPLNVIDRSYKSAGVHDIVVSNFIDTRDLNTQQGGAKFKIKSDGNAVMKVNGWALAFMLRK